MNLKTKFKFKIRILKTKRKKTEKEKEKGSYLDPRLQFGPVKLSLRAAHSTTWRRQLGPMRQPLSARASQILRTVITDGRALAVSHPFPCTNSFPVTMLRAQAVSFVPQPSSSRTTLDFRHVPPQPRGSRAHLGSLVTTAYLIAHVGPTRQLFLQSRHAPNRNCDGRELNKLC
jgi:hypothetical protein